jgi:asparagine synthase (glutamine-hydrolyzing)
MLRDRNVLVHNGEIYNYLELSAGLRELGETIGSETDTEVILAAYRVWGIDAVARFNGMFAFALWDADRKRLILARDRMGVKPLYIRRTAHALAFASEPAALLAGRPIDSADNWIPEPHVGAVRDFLMRGLTDHSLQTFFDGIVALAPGHLLIVDGESETTVRYWGPPALGEDVRFAVRGIEKERDRALVDEFTDLFDSSVRLRLRSDVPIGTCLSGGLDSSSIVATVADIVSAGASRQNHEQVPRLAFHARFPADGIDESAFAEAVASRSGVRLIHRTPSGDPLLAAILPVLRAQGEPYGGASINAQYAVMSAAHDEGLKVLLDGQGADELLGGYLRYLGVRAAGLLRSGDPLGALSEMRNQVARGTMSPSGAIASAIRGAVPGGTVEAVRASSRGRFGIRPGPSLRGVQPLTTPRTMPGTLLAGCLWQALTTDSLPALLRYEDRNSMAFGVEARVPFLDVRLIEMAVRLPDRLRIDRGVTKAILRLAMKGRIPEEVRDRRDKLGFVAPQRSWLTAARTEVAEVLRGGQIVERGWVGSTEVDRLLVDGFSSRRASEHLWRLLITEAWLRLWWPDRTTAGAPTWEAALASTPPGPVQPPSC